MDLPEAKLENLELANEKKAAENFERMRMLLDKIYLENEATHIAAIDALIRLDDLGNLTPKQESLLQFLEIEYAFLQQ